MAANCALILLGIGTGFLGIALWEFAKRFGGTDG